MKDWQGKTVLVVGAARQGLSATRFLATHGSAVILNDARPEDLFLEHINSLQDLPINFVFGSHPLSLLDQVDGICVSGGVPLSIPLIKTAVEKGFPLFNDAQLFMDRVQAKVIGITGSAGKTTTTTLIGEIAKTAVSIDQNVWVGGNIGNPLINHINEIKQNDLVVMELSSFQLELMHASPEIALVLNITPNHLDRHGTMKAYIEAKARILQFQAESDIAILNRDDAGSYGLAARVVGDLFTFGKEQPGEGEKGTFLNNGQIIYTDGKRNNLILSAEEVQLPGQHNTMNALAAAAAGIAAGFAPDSIRQGIQSVSGIPHRLELIGEINGVRWINDSIATAPERVIAALDSIPGKIVLLLGGRDKDLPWSDLAAVLHNRKPKVVLFGEAGSLVREALYKFENDQPSYPIHEVSAFSEAVHKAGEIAQPGEQVLLSPGGTSYDEFTDFEERGELFRKLVEEMA